MSLPLSRMELIVFEPQPLGHVARELSGLLQQFDVSYAVFTSIHVGGKVAIKLLNSTCNICANQEKKFQLRGKITRIIYDFHFPFMIFKGVKILVYV